MSSVGSSEAQVKFERFLRGGNEASAALAKGLFQERKANPNVDAAVVGSLGNVEGRDYYLVVAPGMEPKAGAPCGIPKLASIGRNERGEVVARLESPSQRLESMIREFNRGIDGGFEALISGAASVGVTQYFVVGEGVVAGTAAALAATRSAASSLNVPTHPSGRALKLSEIDEVLKLLGDTHFASELAAIAKAVQSNNRNAVLLAVAPGDPSKALTVSWTGSVTLKERVAAGSQAATWQTSSGSATSMLAAGFDAAAIRQLVSGAVQAIAGNGSGLTYI